VNPAHGAVNGDGKQVTVACYTFPHYHPSALSDRLYGPGWTEYTIARGARPWFPGHQQPRVPLLGELDERDPGTWETYIPLAADHGVDVLIWDSYWYGGEPALHEALEDGYLRARNDRGLQFAVMWTNHPWTRVYPTMHPDGSDAWEHAFPSPSDRAEDAWRSLSYLVARYMHHPLYWRLAGRPVLCVWDAGRLARTFGVEGTRELLDDVRTLAERMGHGGLHVHAAMPSDDLEAMGFDTYGDYTCLPRAAGRRPETEQLPEYDTVVDDVIARLWPEADGRSTLPYFPAVNPGWDTAPRFLPAERGDGSTRTEWPGLAYWGDPMAIVGDTPAGFKAFVEAAVGFLRQRPDQPQVLTIGCWNEWTEGHYLLPDNRFGYGMLKALAEAVTGESTKSPDDWTHGTGALATER
jgi:Glycosyltransferase WbsX